MKHIGSRRSQSQAESSDKPTAKSAENTNTVADERELLNRFKQEASKNQAFEQIVRKYRQRIYMHIRKMVIDHDDADDLTQEVFVKAWRNLDSFRQEAQLFTWLYRIASNECLNFLDKKRRRFLIPVYNVCKELTKKLETHGNFSGDEIQLKLQKALLRLPDKQRLVFNLRYYDELSYEEIAEITGTSKGALKASYHHAVKKIENYLTEN